MSYICMTPEHWGRGDTVEAAKNTTRKHGGRLTQYVVYKLPDEAIDPFVDDLGQIHWTWPEDYDGPRIVDLEIVARRGV